MHLIQIVGLLLMIATQHLCAESEDIDLKGKVHLVNGCKVFNLQGRLLKVFAGEYCVYLRNGDFVSMTHSTLKYVSKEGEVKWSDTNPYFHHQINISNDSKRLLVLGSVERVIEKKKYRIDAFTVYEAATGKVIFRTDSEQLITKARVDPFIMRGTFPKREFSTHHEYSHFNSFYEIPEFPKDLAIDPIIKKSKYIINSIGIGFFLIDEKLREVLFHKKIPDAYAHMVHDVQITQRGTILAFVNKNMSKKFEPFSSVVEFEFPSFKKIIEIKSDLPSLFYSRFCGGVQDLGSSLIGFSHHFAGVYVYDVKMKKIVYYNDSVHKDGNRLVPSQQVKFENLDAFLKNHSAGSF